MNAPWRVLAGSVVIGRPLSQFARATAASPEDRQKKRRKKQMLFSTRKRPNTT
jgi:hypothetical protein